MYKNRKAFAITLFKLQKGFNSSSLTCKAKMCIRKTQLRNINQENRLTQKCQSLISVIQYPAHRSKEYQLNCQDVLSVIHAR